MKKVIFAFVAMCAIVFCGCEKEDGNDISGKLMFNGVNLVGRWICVDCSYSPRDHENGSADICYYHVITPDTYIEYSVTNEIYYMLEDGTIDIEFKDGYLYNCSPDYYEEDMRWPLYFNGSKLMAVEALDHKVEIINKDCIKLIDTEWEDGYQILQRLKGFIK